MGMMYQDKICNSFPPVKHLVFSLVFWFSIKIFVFSKLPVFLTKIGSMFDCCDLDL